MILWSVGTAVLTIWFVFGDPRFDYRWLILGSVAPLAIDVWSGGAWVMHTVLVSVLLMTAVMLGTIGKRAVRRSLLGLPLGTFLYLVFSGAWADQNVFWWPFSGWASDWAPLPITERGWWNLPLEVAGAAMLLWIARTTRIVERPQRIEFWRTGQLRLPPDVNEDSQC